MTVWDDVVVRARGLGSRLLGRRRLEAIANARDLDSIAALLAESGYESIPERGGVDPRALEHAIRRAAAAKLEILGQWCGPRVALLAPLFEDQDRSNVRAIVRSIASGAALEQRTSGLLPTPSLTGSMLEELASKDRLADVAATLIAWNHPYGSAMLAEASRPHPDLFRLQLAVDRVWAERGLTAGAAVGGSLSRYITLQIDSENIWSALALAEGAAEADPKDLFLIGGELVTRAVFEQLARTADPAVRQAQLERLVAGTPLAPLACSTTREQSLEDALLSATIIALRRTVRVHPLDVDVLLDYVLRLRAEVRDLARIVWGVSLHAPRRRLIAAMATT